MSRLTFGIALDFGSTLRPLQAQLARQSALLEPAEAAGFDVVAAGETSSPGAFHLPNALLVLAALAQRTRMRLCTGILLLPAWPVWKLALDAAQLDQLSGGRVILGVGLGSAALRQRAGWPADAIGETVDEVLRCLRQLWSGASEFDGAHVQASGALPVLPLNGERVPIWVGGAIRRSAVRGALLGDGWYGGVNYRLSDIPRQSATYRSAVADTVNGAVVVNRVTLVAPTQPEVAELFERHLRGALAGYGRPGESVEQVREQVALIGTPETVSALLERYAAAGVTHVFARLSLDDMPPDVARTTIELFGREIIPRFTPA